MSEVPLEEVISEAAFARILEAQGAMCFRLATTLVAKPDDAWTRRDFYQLVSETDSIEALLDDHGARHNRAYSFLRELVASARSFALAGFSLAHLERRFAGYATVLSTSEADSAVESLRRARTFLQQTLRALVHATTEDLRANGVSLSTEAFPEERYAPETRRLVLPRSMGQEDLSNDEQMVGEIAAKFVEVAGLLDEIGVRRIANERERESFLARACTEERARNYEARVHNLQSTYDTYLKNTRIEAGDARLPKMRGHASAALHMLEAVTHLTHFVERHESGKGQESIVQRLLVIVNRAEVHDVTLNHLMYWACLFMKRGRSIAEDLLSSYTRQGEYIVELGEELVLHARPAALIVGIVNHFGTPVRLEVKGRSCNAASIIDMMVTVGTNPEERRYVFRGDEKPLRDIQSLFESGLGEGGLENLPRELAYLRTGR